MDHSGNDAWANAAIKQMWPFMAEFIGTTAKEVMQPMIRAALPRPMRGFEFIETDVSHCAPMTVSNLHTVHEATSASDENVVQIRFDVHADLVKPNFSMKVKLMPGVLHMSRMTLKGRMGVVLRPLTNSVPFFGAMQAFFPNPPDIRLHFEGVGKLAQLPFIRRVVQNTLNATVGSMLVLPNTLVVKMLEMDGLYEQIYVWPLGIARVNLVEAKGLPNRDNNVINGLSDPYGIVRLGPDSYRTSVKRNTLNPIWSTDDDKSAHDFIISSTRQLLTVDMMDKDRGNVDDELGSVSLVLSELLEKGDMWYSLVDGEGGKIRLQADMLQAVPLTPEMDISFPDSFLLTVMVERATGVPRVGTKKLVPQVTVRCDRSKQSFKTFPVIAPNLGPNHNAQLLFDPTNPRWEQSFNYHISKADLDANIEFELTSQLASLGSLKIPVQAVRQSEGSYMHIRRHRLDTAADDASTQLYVGLRLHSLIASEPREQSGGIDSTAFLQEPLSEESSDIINDMMEKFWPHASSYLVRAVRTVTEPMISEIAPGILKGLSFTELSFGSACPARVSNLRVVPSAGYVSICADLHVDCRPTVSLTFARVSGGLSRLALEGSVRMVLMPLCSSPPFFDATSVSFTNSPKIDVEFSGIASVGNAATVLRSFILDLIETQVRAAIVSPHESVMEADLVMPLDTSLPEVERPKDLGPVFYSTLRPLEGVLRIQIVAAEQLIHTDFGTQSDPYAEVIVGGTAWKSSVVNNNENPVWPSDQVFDFPTSGLQDQHMEIRLWDSDAVLPDDPLGVARVNDIHGLVASCAADDDGATWLDLKEVNHGRVCIRAWFYYMKRGRPVFAPPEIDCTETSVPFPQSLCTIMVQSAVGLPAKIGSVTTRPALRISLLVDGEVKRTQTSPVFVPLPPEEQESLHIRGLDADKPFWNYSSYWVLLEAMEQRARWRFDILQLGLKKIASAEVPCEDVVSAGGDLVDGIPLDLLDDSGSEDSPDEDDVKPRLFMKLLLRSLSRQPV